MENIADEREGLKNFLEEAELDQYYEFFRDILKVTKISQLKFVAREDLVQIGLSKPEQRRYKKMYAKYFPNPYISKIKQLLTTSKKTEVFPHGHSSLPIDFQPFTEQSVKVPTKHIISIEDITINKELGMGQFGVVQQGTWTTGNQRLQVAIKCLGHERMTSNSTEFLKEAAVMHSIEHPNIVRLYGVVLHLDSLMLVTELAPLRSLLECLREVSLRTNFPVTNLCEFAEQICDGMTYLENKRLIHRDLAARNILVFNKDRVKISDFGLSRALGVGKDYYQTNYNVNLKLPVAWCAPECILYLRFTSSSDVWAFGVCLWEMFTYGFQPWAAFSGQQILEAIDAPNFQRLERPECCPEAYYATMLDCWAHEPTDRPKFKDLGLKLRAIRPEEVQATTDFQRPEDGRRSNFLEYKTGQIITVLGKENMTNSSMWYGVLSGGACGFFDPNHTKPYVKPERGACALPVALSPHPARQSARSLRPALLRTDVKRHTYTAKRTINRAMISSPQGHVKHISHVGLDGAYFGDVSFLPADCPPRQIVTPYKPSEDLEQVPLINPNSPSHLSGASGAPYPLLNPRADKPDCDELALTYPETKSKPSKKTNHKSNQEPTTSRGLLNKVKCATLGRSHKTDKVDGGPSKTDEVHEYHEISDTDTESTAAEHIKIDSLASPESPGVPKSYGDLNLLHEMESIWRYLDSRHNADAGASTKSIDVDSNIRSSTLTKAERKKSFNTGTMKLMSAYDEKTLDTAVALANELTTRSMNDLGTEHKAPSSPNERYKFTFKFPLVSLYHHHVPPDPDKEPDKVKQERRNFSEEAKSVPDIQASITEECKQAYTSLIEQPTPSSALLSQIAGAGAHGNATIPKPTSRTSESRARFHSLQKHYSQSTCGMTSDQNNKNEANFNNAENVLPLPPRTTKPKLVDKPRHIRKYPLKIPTSASQPPPAEVTAQTARPIIYQNTMTCPIVKMHHRNGQECTVQSQNDKDGVDVCDGPKSTKTDTNPFKRNSGQSSANPFNYYLETIGESEKSNEDTQADARSTEEGSLVKDHVSVEDLLEFADQKPCGRQRGVESDEVRIMVKVLKNEASPEECIEALEMFSWNVHHAIKVMRVRLTVAENNCSATLEECDRGLLDADGDFVKAATNILLNKK